MPRLLPVGDPGDGSPLVRGSLDRRQARRPEENESRAAKARVPVMGGLGLAGVLGPAVLSGAAMAQTADQPGVKAESPRHKDSNPRALSFPLEVGKRWHYATDWVFKPKASRGSSRIEVAVVAREKIRVPAGEFDAFRLESRGSLHGVSPINSHYAGETTATYWYAPAARAIVKSVSHNPYLGTTTVELVEFRLEP